ncbi:MAG: DNA polymerase IV [Eubacteriales bacterium]|nr:DNA polymerase IV [Eubacteriales bacterium]
MERTILHCDCNGFYASVECIHNPALRQVPMAVAGSQDDRHGIILAKNELAKRAGVVTAETIWQARKKCPDLTVVPPRHGEYSYYSRLVNAIYGRYTGQVEPFGIDESWLDVTGSLHLFGTGRQIADEIRAAVRQELGLTVSVGVSFNKIFAKLGSDYKKPDATTEITRDNFEQILFPLPVDALLYVGDTARAALAQLGIHTIGQLAVAPVDALRRKLGKMADTLHAYANGWEDSPVLRADHQREIKSVGNGMTFRRNLTGEQDLRIGLISLCDEVASRLRGYGMKCTTVQVQIKNPSLKTISRQKALEAPTALARELFETALDLVRANWSMDSPIRMLTVTGLQLVSAEEAGEQLTFLRPAAKWERKKQERVENTIDAIRQKFGHDAVSFGTQLRSDLDSDGADDTDNRPYGERNQ